MPSRISVSVVCAGLAVVGLSVGCRVPSSRGPDRQADRSSLGSQRLEFAEILEKTARRGGSTRSRTASFLEAADVYVSHGRFDDALRCVLESRALYPPGRVPGEVHRALGAVYLKLGDLRLATRYLAKGLAGASGHERELVLARLAVCARWNGDTQAAARYRGQLATPIPPEVFSILESSRPAPKKPKRVAARPSPSRPTPPRSPATRERSGTRRLVVIPRSMWRARPVKERSTRGMGRITRMTVHHTGDDPIWSRDLTEAAALIRRIQNYHQEHRGWADIGYHYIVDRSGHVWQGRPLKYQGAHARGSANRGNIGVVVLGNYTRQRLTEAQRETLLILLAKLSSYFSIPPEKIYTHSEILGGSTDCPGPELARYVRAARETLKSLAQR